MRKLALLGAAGLLFAAANAPAALISVNFTGGGGFPLAATDQAGNPSIAGAFAANWNNVGNAASGSQLALVDSAGIATSVNTEWATTLGTWSLPSTSGGTNLSGGANPQMMRGYLDADGNPATVKFTNLSSVFSSYKVLIYFDGDNGGDWRVGQYTITDTNTTTQLFQDGGEDSENVDFNKGSGQNANGLFQVPAPGAGGNQPYPTSPNNDEGNFLITGDLTNDAITITAVGTAAGSGTLRAPINGIQIIGEPVPEPGTLSLLALGAVGLLARRRR